VTPPPGVSFATASSRVDEDARAATITVRLSAVSDQQATVQYATGDGSATAPGDYATTSGTLTFSPGQTSKTFSVPIANDSLDEQNETVELSLSNPTNANLGSPPSATLTIYDDDMPPPTVSISASDPSAAEAGSDSGAFLIARDGNTAAPLTIHYTVAGSASADDYNVLPGSVVLPASQSSASITITPADDTKIEGNETVVVTLANDPQYTVGEAHSATVTIADDDTPTPSVTISASDPGAAEAGLDPGVLTITRSGSTAAPLLVHYSISGTATAGSDYAALAGTITIPAGQSSATITIAPIDDTAVEGVETVVVTVSADPAYEVGASASASATIADDDIAPAPEWLIYLPVVRRSQSPAHFERFH
jgi:hypothetical protein